MTKIKIEKLIWDNFNLNHLSKHGVIKLDIEESIKNVIYHEHSYLDRYIVIVKNDEKILSLIVSRKGPKTYYIVSARNASRKERKKQKLYESHK